jgi:plastocyanin
MALTPNALLSPPLRRLAASGAMAATVLAVAACGSTGDGTSASSSSGSAAAGGPTVVARNFSFSPTNVPVTAGGQVTVTFDNQGTTEHSLTLDNGSGETEAAGGKQATLTFTAPGSGSLTFHCKYHPTLMKGSFTTGGGSGGSGGSSGSGSSSSSSSSYGY